MLLRLVPIGDSREVRIPAAMLNQIGAADTVELLVEDGLHMTPEGYKIWNAAVRPFLQLDKSTLPIYQR